MKNKLLKYTVAFSIITLSFLQSCIKEVSLEMPKFAPQLVVNGFLNPDSTLKLRLTSIRGMSDSISPIVSDAKILVYENNQAFDSLEYETDGYFKGNRKPVSGNVYRLKVTSLDYGETTACDTIYHIPELDIEATTTGLIGTDMNQNKFAQMNIVFNDDADLRNYYEIRLKNEFFYTDMEYNPESDTWEEITDTSFFRTDWFSAENDILESNPNADQKKSGPILLSDKNFNGNRYKLTLYYYPSHITSNNDPVIGDYHKIHIWFNCVSKQYYDYKLSIMNAAVNNNSFWLVGDNINIQSNINNGLGFWGMYQTFKDTLSWQK